MITEDYVSFETAKLLKEKGFDEATYQFYKAITYIGTEADDICLKTMGSIESEPFYDSYYGIDLNGEDTGEYACPTLQMAMKWLRNIHDIVCSVGLFTDLPEMPPYWSFNILNQSTANTMYEAFDVKCETYEEACEAAIKYCLENLI